MGVDFVPKDVTHLFVMLWICKHMLSQPLSFRIVIMMVLTKPNRSRVKMQCQIYEPS